MATSKPLVINGWTLFAHSLFLEQLEALLQKVERLLRKGPKGYTRKNPTKQLAAIAKLAFEIIPQDPARTDYRQGSTLGDEHKHWFRAKFFQQYRLFFRYHQESKIIIYAWVNDDHTKRAYGSSTDAYRIFRRMIESGHPPDDWKTLLTEARQESKRLQDTLEKSGRAPD
ncbi:MAG: type II toxin-antitoxin system YhaV family toxin [Candidatus Thiodiazotropha sp. (ex Epidulcina cf. delphinae)]|nr:type II toxin-antitoxin system YhaV family toxin [Candidatus Thiodiazotropha sp. (ex Epidulcina cf. delphinae)]